VARGSNYWDQTWSDEDFLSPLPPPEFNEPIEVPRERIAKIIGKLSVARDIRYWHPAIDRFLKEDDKRREKQLATLHPMSWNNPRFDTPIERRRLRILNTLFSAAARMNGKPTIGGREARSIHVTFYQQHVVSDWIAQNNTIAVVLPQQNRLSQMIRSCPFRFLRVSARRTPAVVWSSWRFSAIRICSQLRGLPIFSFYFRLEEAAIAATLTDFFHPPTSTQTLSAIHA
jgi:hypothetical protein